MNNNFVFYQCGMRSSCSSRETLRVLLHTLLYYKLLYTIACLVFAFINLEISQSIVMSISTLFFPAHGRLSHSRTSSRHWDSFALSKVQRADLTCDVIRKVAPFVLSKLWVLIDDWSMCWSRDTFLIKLRLYLRMQPRFSDLVPTLIDALWQNLCCECWQN